VERALIDFYITTHQHSLDLKYRGVLAGKCIYTMDHPPDSPDLAQADFWQFPKHKSVLEAKCFSDVENIKLSVKKILTDILVRDFINCFEQCPKRWEHYNELEGGYFENFLVANICSS
jgi:hypothetical protein